MFTVSKTWSNKSGSCMTNTPTQIRILIVEDESLLAMVLEDELHTAGHVVAGTVGTVEALEKALDHQRFDLVLLDVNLHGKSTLGTAQRLQSENRPFIIMSGYGVSGLPDALKTAPCLQKPFEMAQLHNEIGRAIGRRD